MIGIRYYLAMSTVCLTLWVGTADASDISSRKDTPAVKAKASAAKQQSRPHYRTAGPLYYRLRTNPKVYRAWQEKNYFEDFENTLRSPLNRESDLDYLLRTF